MRVTWLDSSGARGVLVTDRAEWPSPPLSAVLLQRYSFEAPSQSRNRLLGRALLDGDAASRLRPVGSLVLVNARLVYADGQVVHGGLVARDGVISEVFAGDPPAVPARSGGDRRGRQARAPGARGSARAALPTARLRSLRDRDAARPRSAASRRS